MTTEVWTRKVTTQSTQKVKPAVLLLQNRDENSLSGPDFFILTHRCRFVSRFCAWLVLSFTSRFWLSASASKGLTWVRNQHNLRCVAQPFTMTHTVRDETAQPKARIDWRRTQVTASGKSAFTVLLTLWTTPIAKLSDLQKRSVTDSSFNRSRRQPAPRYVCVYASTATTTQRYNPLEITTPMARTPSLTRDNERPNLRSQPRYDTLFGHRPGGSICR